MTQIAEDNALVGSTSTDDSGPASETTDSACRICAVGWYLCRPKCAVDLYFDIEYRKQLGPQF